MNARESRKTRMYDQIRRHGEHLQAIFPKTRALDPVALCKKLLRLENEAHRAAERHCNGYLDSEGMEKLEASVLKRLDAVLGFRKQGVPVFVNGDPRGYALKIDDDYVRSHNLDIHRDFGGYGIICPTFDGR